MNATLCGPNDFHLEKDPHSDRYLPQPGLGEEAEALLRAKRGPSPTEIAEMRARATRLTEAEQLLNAQQAELERGRAAVTALAEETARTKAALEQQQREAAQLQADLVRREAALARKEQKAATAP
jgi:peptidoglycan hydrolase CwlO-like protein